MAEFPDQKEDDIKFARLFSEWGMQSRMRRLMGVTAETLRRMLNPDDVLHPSDLHRARRLVFAGYEESAETGADIWAELEEAKARVISRRRPERSRFPSKMAFKVIERETNSTPDELSAIPLGVRLSDLNALLDSVAEYRDHLARENSAYFEDARIFRGEDGPQRVTGRGVNSSEPIRAAAKR